MWKKNWPYSFNKRFAEAEKVSLLAWRFYSKTYLFFSISSLCTSFSKQTWWLFCLFFENLSSAQSVCESFLWTSDQFQFLDSAFLHLLAYLFSSMKYISTAKQRKKKSCTVIHLQSSSYLLNFMKNSFIESPEKDILIQPHVLVRRQVCVWWELFSRKWP